MEKKTKNTSNKASRAVDSGLPPATITIASSVHLKSNTFVPFRLADTFTDPIAIPVLPRDKENLIGTLHALKDNCSVPKLSFLKYLWKQDELKVLEECLAANRGLTEIEFNESTLTNIFMESFVRMLKRNKTIRTISFYYTPLPREAWLRFCDGLEYYNIDSLKLAGESQNEDKIKDFCEGIAFNQTIKTLSLTSETFPERSLERLCTMLANNPAIENLEFIRCFYHQVDYGNFNRVIKAGYLKVLTLDSSYLIGRNLKLISKELQNNTSITELNIPGNSPGWIELGIILSNNRTIKKLDLKSCANLQKESIADLKLRDNKTLTSLSVATCYNLPLSALFEELVHNTTLKALKIGNNAAPSRSKEQALEDYLATTKTLRELHVEYMFSGINMANCLEAIANGLKINKSVRKLTVHLSEQECQPFFEALKCNSSLTYLDIGMTTWRENSVREDSILDLLRTNRTLRHIVGAENFVQLEKNRVEQDKIIMNTCMLIKMILAKPSSFILPMEVWSNIISYTSYSFVPFDFEQFFKKSMV